MSTVTAWYRSNNRAWQIHQSPYLARTDSAASRRAIAMAQTDQNAVVINMGETAPSNSNAGTQEKKKQDTLFGPNIGIVSTGPKWTERTDKSTNELTPEVVKGWVAKSKEANHVTTTLQALVNLKRPTLRLTPLEVSSADDPDHKDSQHHHGLEFEYDCDSAKCGIYVHVILSPSHHLAQTSAGNQQTKLLVFETVTEGGFGKILKLEAGAMLELGRFEHRPRTSSLVSDELAASSTPSEIPGSDDATSIGTEPRHRKRFTHFHFRKRNVDRSVAGPALAVLDAESHTHPSDGEKEVQQDESNLGVKVTIRLVALDEEGNELAFPNEQITYLHIVRYGSPPVHMHGAEHEEDKRPWVVKVVKREATIGPHTFHLHEIYGLSANSTTATHTVAPTAPPALETHSYPPTSPPATSTPALQDDGTSSECLLCLSSPREVVLLPCRHLVACRECAVNMIEFGAGGTIARTESNDGTSASVPAGDESTPANVETDGATGEEGGEGSAPAPTPSDPTAAIQPVPTPVIIPAVNNHRRKRKAKGWFCPVCRQPYTSMLRITTTPPSKDITDDDQQESSDMGEDIAGPPPQSPAIPQPLAVPPPAARLTRPGRPGFLRAFSRGNIQQPPDVERGAAASAN
ncbi:unnamed protein product [Somion occarium]|uniref:RING-type domain-containing protein n=1 Tax=Somion occarium TaxID=3059160 RepID=A0ABP1CU98_9APHY